MKNKLGFGPTIPHYPGEQSYARKTYWLLRWGPVVILWVYILWLAGIQVQSVEALYEQRGE